MLTGVRRPGGRQRSSRSGGRPPARIRKRVYLPTRPRWRTSISKRVLAASRRSRARRRTGWPCERRRSGRRGQPVPRQRAVTTAPRGAVTTSTRTHAPRGRSCPAIRTMGKGVIRSFASSTVPGASGCGEGATGAGVGSVSGVATSGFTTVDLDEKRHSQLHGMRHSGMVQPCPLSPNRRHRLS